MSERAPQGAEMKLMELFEEGKRFTQDLLKENEKLRLVIANLRTECRELESRYVKVDVPRLQQKLQLLEQENTDLRRECDQLHQQFRTIEEENRDFAERYVKVERQNSDLVSLYVASHRLHSTLNYDEVVQIVKEIVINMIGAAAFGVYLVDPVHQHIVLIAGEGIEEEVGSSKPLTSDALGEAAKSGQVWVMKGDVNTGKADQAIACIPLKVGDDVMGLIAINQLLVQKDGFASVDFELFELLGGHAATAIYVSKLYSLSERKRATLEGFLDLLRSDIHTVR